MATFLKNVIENYSKINLPTTNFFIKKRVFYLFILICINLYEIFNILLRHIILKGILVDYYFDSIFRFNIISYFMNYSIEFYRRSLIGNFFHFLNIDINPIVLITTKFIILNLLGFLLLNIFHKARFPRVFIFFIFFSPFLFPQITYMGLTINDLLTFIFFSIAILIFHKERFFYFLPIIILLGGLNHMLFLLAFVPTLLLLTYCYKQMKVFVISIISFGVTLIALLAYGDISIDSIEGLRNVIINNNFEFTHAWEKEIISLNEFSTNLKFGTTYLPKLWFNRHFFDQLIFLLVPLYFIFLISIFKIRKTSFSPNLILIIFTTFSGFILFLIGSDYPRWFGVILFNIVLTSTLFTNKFDIKLNNIHKLIFTSYCILGCFGHYDAFPVISRLIKHVLNLNI
jgi:hypothetical protein